MHEFLFQKVLSVCIDRTTHKKKVAQKSGESRHCIFVGMLICVFSMVTGFLPLCAQDISKAEVHKESPSTPQSIFEKAVVLFFDAKPVESANAFDQLIEVQPECQPDLWQRGLALYYAGRFEDGQKQFELHKTVNPNDVENPAWHYLCVARATSPENACRHMLAVGTDLRVPMKQILAFYQGNCSEQDVLAAAGVGSSEAQRNQFCYAHLYLGLYAEANGDMGKAKHHILQAAGPYAMNHYMGRVANVHARIRGWLLSAE